MADIPLYLYVTFSLPIPLPMDSVVGMLSK